MTEINYSTLLREVVADYFEKRLTRTEYLALRRKILTSIDHEFNGENPTSLEDDSDVTRPRDRGINSQSPTSRMDQTNPKFDRGQGEM